MGAKGEPASRPLRRAGRWASAVAAVQMGRVGGVGGYTFGYADGVSYLSDDPRACVNCHMMRDQYESWLRSSHHAVATGNDCHLPRDPIGQWLAKTRHGWNHSVAFTLGRFPEPIRI